MQTHESTHRPARSLDELLDGATERVPMKTADSKSAAHFERVTIAGDHYVVKHFGGDDWLAEASQDHAARAVTLWEDGVYQTLADVVDSAVVGAARCTPDAPYPAALLMRDVAEWLVPEDAAVDERTHAAIIDAMAAIHVRFWNAPPVTTYMPFAVNYTVLSPGQAQRERELGDRSDVLRMVEPGWAEVAKTHAELAAAVRPLLADPRPLVDALATTPVTFLQGDWKMGNLGCHDDGTVVLLDWDRPAVGPATADLAWYVAVNCDRLPESKEATLGRYRDSLERQGIDSAAWWDRQMTLTLLGAFLQLGWSKGGQVDELSWWHDRVIAAATTL